MNVNTGVPNSDVEDRRVERRIGSDDPAWRAWFHLQCALRANTTEQRMMELRAASYDFDRIKREVEEWMS